MTGSLHQVNLERLQEIITNEPVAIASERFGNLGSARLKDILRFFRRLSARTRVGDNSVLTVFALIEDESSMATARLAKAKKFDFGSPSAVEIESLIIEIRTDGTAFVWSDLPGELHVASAKAIIYRLLQGVETFEIAATPVVVQKIIEDSVSQFLFHYFNTLRDALHHYRDEVARTSTQYMLREAWYDENRLWFKAGPEYILRRSLCDFLRAFLRYDNLWLRPEQNVDESHPVDIKIKWPTDNREAIIEVKWLGKSRTDAKQTKNNGEGIARAGAKQLAEYLESLRQESAGADARGYLVVFDGRRDGLKLSDIETTRAKGMYFSTREITYNPNYHKDREDFDPPIRMFLEPRIV